MAYLERAKAILRISGDDMLPEEISALLGACPTASHAKGHEIKYASGRTRITKFGLWSLAATDTEQENLNKQVAEILDQLSGDLAIWQGLGERFEIDLFCGWFMGCGNEGIEISPRAMLGSGNAAFF
jgi:hypothetical protein